MRERPILVLALLAGAHTGVAGCSRSGGATGSSKPLDGGLDAGGDHAEHASWPMPNPSSLGLPNPQAYDVGPNGTVTDKVTGLVWQKTIDPTPFDWNAASAYCNGLVLGGYDDWRVPSMIELVSIVDVSRYDPAIRADAFPNTPSVPFWSSQLDFDNSGLGWYVFFKNGGPYGGNDVVDPQSVRCVRSPIPHAAADYVATAEGAIQDPSTGLTWQRLVEPASYTWADARSHCAAIAPAGTWRLPSLNELMTLVDLSRVDPAIDTAAFPDTPSEFFWSSSASFAPSDTAWGVNFNRGSAGASMSASASRVRCLR